MQLLEAEGYERIDAPEGIYLAMPGRRRMAATPRATAADLPLHADDVRWATTKADVTAT